jgi:hypothetical protein
MDEESQAPAMPVYPVGTPLDSIRVWDRGIKVRFQCSVHRGAEWVSKEPRVSSWFIAKDGPDCMCKTINMVTTAEYAPQKNSWSPYQ